MRFHLQFVVLFLVSSSRLLAGDPFISIPYPDPPEVANCPNGPAPSLGDSLFCLGDGDKSDGDGGCQAALAEAQNDLSVCQSRETGACRNSGGQATWGQAASNPPSGCIQPPGSDKHQVRMAISGRCCGNSGSGVEPETDHYSAKCPTGKVMVWEGKLSGSGTGNTCHRAENDALSDVLSQMSKAEARCRNGGYTFVSNLSGAPNGTGCRAMAGVLLSSVRRANVVCCANSPQTSPPPIRKGR